MSHGVYFLMVFFSLIPVSNSCMIANINKARAAHNSQQETSQQTKSCFALSSIATTILQQNRVTPTDLTKIQTKKDFMEDVYHNTSSCAYKTRRNTTPPLQCRAILELPHGGFRLTFTKTIGNALSKL